MSHILHRITASSIATGVYLRQTPEGWHAYRIDLRRQKGEVVVAHQGEEGTTLESLAESIPVGRPLYLVLDAKGILHRFVPEATPADALARAFPNLESDTVFPQWHSLEQGVQLSLVRHDQLNPWLATFEEKKRFVWSLGLGPWGLHRLASAVGTQGPHSLQVGAHILHFQGPQWVSNGETQPASSWTLGDTMLEAEFLPAYAAALSYFAAPPSPVPAGVPEDSQRREGMHQRLYRKAGVAALAVSFLLVLVNALLFVAFSDKNQTLGVSYAAIAQQVEDYEELVEEITEQKAFLRQLGWGDRPPFVFYSDQIGQTVPFDIRLSGLTIHPQDEQEEDRNRRTIFTPDRIEVSGVGQSNLSLTRWLTLLETLPWVGEVQNPEWQVMPREAGGRFSFTLKVAAP